MSAPLPYARCHGQWFLRLLALVTLAVVIAFVAALVWKSMG